MVPAEGLACFSLSEASLASRTPSFSNVPTQRAALSFRKPDSYCHENPCNSHKFCQFCEEMLWLWGKGIGRLQCCLPGTPQTPVFLKVLHVVILLSGLGRGHVQRNTWRIGITPEDAPTSQRGSTPRVMPGSLAQIVSAPELRGQMT